MLLEKKLFWEGNGMTKNNLILSRDGIKRIISWVQLRIWLAVCNIFIIVGGTGWTWYHYHTILPIEITVLIGCATFVLLSICIIQISHGSTQTKILKQKDLEHCIRMDIVDAVESTLGMVLKKYVPGYKNTLTNLSVGEELIKEVKIVTERYAKFQASLLKQMPKMQLAEAIDAFIEQSAKKHGVSENVIDMESFLRPRTAAE